MESLLAFDGEPGDFLHAWLRGASANIHAAGAAVLQASAQQDLKVLTIHPEPPSDSLPPSWLLVAGGRLKRSPLEQPEVLDIPAQDGMYGAHRSQQVLVYPLMLGGAMVATAWSYPEGCPPLDRVLVPLTAMVGLLRHFEYRHQTRQQLAAMGRLRGAVEIQTQMERQGRSLGAAMALCNELASRYHAERVSIGVLKNRSIKLLAMDHTEKIGGKMKLIRQIETVMEECVDQDQTVLFPAPEESPVVCRAASELARREGTAQILSLPIRRDGAPVMVVTLEFSSQSPLTMESLESLRLLGELVGPRLYERYLNDRWVGARWTRSTRKGLAWVLGAKHTWMKLLAIVILGFILFACLFKGDYVVEAPIRLDAVKQHIASSPTDSYLLSVHVKPGQAVEAGDVLAVLDGSELEKQLASLEAQEDTYRREAMLAQDAGKIAEMQIAQARREQVAAKISLLEYQLSRLTIKSPIKGYVVSPDLTRQIGKSVKTGDGLFEIAAVDSMRAVLRVPEEDIVQLKKDQGGELAITAHPETKLPFVIERIHPIASSESDGQEKTNSFEVWAELKEKPQWLRPGMEGEAEVQIGRRRYAWIWTHRMVDWVRMKWWEWF